jgi:hypothetical protein
MFTFSLSDPMYRTSRQGFQVLTASKGGGYTLGDLTVDAELCMLIRNRVGITVIDIDYRLCPGKCNSSSLADRQQGLPLSEYTFLKGHDDAWSAINWVTSPSSSQPTPSKTM